MNDSKQDPFFPAMYALILSIPAALFVGFIILWLAGGL